MQNSKLIHFLRLLRKAERKPFTLFLQSPYFNKRRDVLALFEVLWGEMHGKKNSEMKEEEIYKKTMPGKKFNANGFRKLCSELLGQLLGFWSLGGGEVYRRERRARLLKELNERGEEKYFPSILKQAKKELEESKPLPPSFFEEAYQLELTHSVYLNRTGGRKGDLNLDELYALLSKSHLLRILKLAGSAAAVAQINGQKPAPSLEDIPKFAAGLAPSLPNVHFVLQLYYYRYLLSMQPENEDNFRLLRHGFTEHMAMLDANDRDELSVGMVNFCIRKINQGKPAYQNELFQLFQEMVAEKIWMVDGQIPQPFFKNLVSLGCKQEAFDWVEDLIERYGGNLPGAHSETALSYNKGILAYYREDYATCIQRFNEVLAALEDVFYGLDARALLLRAYYKTQDLSGMEALSHSFRMYLDRTEGIADYHKDVYASFVRYFRRLYQLDVNDPGKVLNLKTEIEAQRSFAGKDWVLEQLDDLGG